MEAAAGIGEPERPGQVDGDCRRARHRRQMFVSSGGHVGQDRRAAVAVGLERRRTPSVYESIDSEPIA